ncbi:glucose-6-phosphate isomerase [Frigoribacterium sp. CFBP9030]|uniref:glucose-6-phosphate isomerase n=1 Tax=unclassified Frigoribacterium TaxID=2627005 RepID=UPI001780D1A7|nr:glucose-6-phosphate isomerase [Frigoribacterium sp. CFBP9030]MBD8703491.1 glucose-6-phosphate isomerase [Frigoribacterium sp. CFBP 13712]MDY0891001.1 glucose-6-phosphate isomerase [Frigoribacterium sp. CFBP9030]
MTITIAASGAAAEAIEKVVPQLVDDLVASGITAQNPTLWGPDAEDESAKRLGWTEAVVVSTPLIDQIAELREELAGKGVDHVVLAGMGGSSLAPEVITRTYGVELTVLDATEPGQVLTALADRLERTVLVVSSKSGSTVETASQRKTFEKAFRDAGIDPVDRIVVVTDPGSPLDASAREAGYRVFNADPNIGGRYSALSAFGLVPSGLAGADIRELLSEADAVTVELAQDSVDNPGLVLGAVIAGTQPLRDKIAIVADGTHIIGFPDWAEQLIAESTGKQGRGLLPVVLGTDGPEISLDLHDVQVVRLVANAAETREVAPGEVEISGSLGGQIMVWEYAVAVAGRLLDINPFDQPDVESAKIATRALLDDRPAPTPPAFTAEGVEVRQVGGLEVGDSLDSAVTALLSHLDDDGYVSIQAYIDRVANPELETLRDALAARTKRPVTFGWGPRFLHSTGQYHKGGPANGVFLQITQVAERDLEIPESPFTFGQLVQAQAAGDAKVLAEHGRPVLTLTVTDVAAALPALLASLR